MARIACVLVLVGLVPLTAGYSSGAPTAACASMSPQHVGSSVQPGPSPFEISISAGTYFTNQEINLQLSGDYGTLFKGFLVRAFERSPQSNTLTASTGKFVHSPKALTCSYSSDSATHSSSSDKESVYLTWKAPLYSTFVTFRSTVVEKFVKIHTNDEVTIFVQVQDY